MPPTPQTPPSAAEQYEPSGLAPTDAYRRYSNAELPRDPLPRVLDTRYFRETGQRLDLTSRGPWDLIGSHAATQATITTTIEGPVSDFERGMLDRVYPGVNIWQARPANIDETYRDPGRAAHRICELLGTELRTARAILTIAADDITGHRYAYGRWEITGDDDEQSCRIRSVDPATSQPATFDAFAAQYIAGLPSAIFVPIPREHAAAIAAVLRDWANDEGLTCACADVAAAITRRLGPPDGNNPVTGIAYND